MVLVGLIGRITISVAAFFIVVIKNNIAYIFHIIDIWYICTIKTDIYG